MLQKICLTAISLSLISCGGIKEFPDYNPIAIIPSKNKAFKCKLIDKENIVFKCEEQSIPLDSIDLDGYLATSPDETQAVIRWVKDSKNYYKKHCKAK